MEWRVTRSHCRQAKVPDPASALRDAGDCGGRTREAGCEAYLLKSRNEVRDPYHQGTCLDLLARMFLESRVLSPFASLRVEISQEAYLGPVTGGMGCSRRGLPSSPLASPTSDSCRNGDGLGMGPR